MLQSPVLCADADAGLSFLFEQQGYCCGGWAVLCFRRIGMYIENLEIKDKRLPVIFKCPCCKEVLKLFQPNSTAADSRPNEFMYMIVTPDRTAADSD